MYACAHFATTTPAGSALWMLVNPKVPDQSGVSEGLSSGAGSFSSIGSDTGEPSDLRTVSVALHTSPALSASVKEWTTKGTFLLEEPLPVCALSLVTPSQDRMRPSSSGEPSLSQFSTYIVACVLPLGAKSATGVSGVS